MDRTKQYVWMSDDPDIQSLVQLKIGEHYVWWDKRFNEMRQQVLKEQDNIDEIIEFRNDFVFLLRQDQLQAMVEENGSHILDTTDKLLRIWAHYNFPKGSMEQLWLAFVMKEKFNKIWSPDKKIWEDKE